MQKLNRAMLKLTNELVWIKGILKHLEIAQDTPMTMHCDNQAAIHIASNSVFHERTKHIEVDCHKVRQMIVILGVKISWLMYSPRLQGKRQWSPFISDWASLILGREAADPLSHEIFTLFPSLRFCPNGFSLVRFLMRKISWLSKLSLSQS